MTAAWQLDLSRTVRRHRSVLAGLLAAGAVATALPLLAPGPGPVAHVVTAAHDLKAGTPLAAGDVTLIALPVGVVPTGALTDPSTVVGRVPTGPVRRGEPLTDVRLLGSGLLHGHGLVAAPVRVADGATVALLHAGDRVDVLAAPTSADRATAAAVTVAAGVEVLAVPGSDQGNADGGLVVVAATPATAARLAAAAVGSRLSVTVLAP